MKTLKCITWRGYDTPMLFGIDPHETGIEVQFQYASNDDQTLEAARRGSIDIIGGPEIEWIGSMAAEGLCQSIDVERLPNFRKVDPFFANNPLVRFDGALYGIPFTWGI